MKSEWKECKLGDLITFQRGYDLPKYKMQLNGEYPVIGSNGIIGYNDEYTTNPPCITVGRSGNVGKPFLINKKSWSHNTTLYVKEFKNVDPIFIYYFLKTLHLENYAGGSAVPTLNRNHIHTLDVCIPISKDIQKKIASILSALDDKIELNKQINNNLEQQAQAIFKSWFIDFEPFGGVMPSDWVKSTLGDVSEMGAGGDKPRNVSSVKTETCPYPIYSNGLTNEGLYGYTDNAKIKYESVTVSARGTIGFVCLRHIPYFPIVRLITLIPNTNILSAKYLYLYLKQLNIVGTGTTQQQLTVPDFKKYEILIPNKDIIHLFTETINPIFEKIWTNQIENDNLINLRNIILPKLMSGDIEI